eukprot:scaffold52849_cov33-Tisochrysis_lutea.AAC.1
MLAENEVKLKLRWSRHASAAGSGTLRSRLTLRTMPAPARPPLRLRARPSELGLEQARAQRAPPPWAMPADFRLPFV